MSSTVSTDSRTSGQHNYQSSHQQSPWTVIEHFSLTPNSLAVYPRFYKNGISASTQVTEKKDKIYFDEKGNITLIRPDAKPLNGHNFELSKQAGKNLRSKVTWLYYFAKSQTITTTKGKHLSNLKMNFITLKLPSEQIHTSDFITKNCLNQLIVEIKKRYNFKNYVWRLEYQKNGNLHYHIATDTYIDWGFLVQVWNRILNKYGYVDLYTRKFSTMSLSEYIKSQGYGKKLDYKILQERYAKGCADKWTKPNTVDVKAVFGKNNIGFYISKYMSKKENSTEEKKLPICEQNSSNSRLWYCSQSLSKCKSDSDFRESQEIDLFSILHNLEKVKKFVSDYCTILYFNIDELPPLIQGVLRTRLELYRREVNYELVA